MPPAPATMNNAQAMMPRRRVLFEVNLGRRGVMAMTADFLTDQEWRGLRRWRQFIFLVHIFNRGLLILVPIILARWIAHRLF